MTSTDQASVPAHTVPWWIAGVKNSAAQLGISAEEYWERIRERDQEVSGS